MGDFTAFAVTVALLVTVILTTFHYGFKAGVRYTLERICKTMQREHNLDSWHALAFVQTITGTKQGDKHV